MRHPKYQWYTQCLTFQVLPTHGQQVMYSVIGVVTMYIAPLVTIIFCYSAIILEICKRVVDTGTLPRALFSPQKEKEASFWELFCRGIVTFFKQRFSLTQM
jgi:hypothetical protein